MPKSEQGPHFFDPQFWTAAAAIWTAGVLALAVGPDTRTDWVTMAFGDKVTHVSAFVLGGIFWVKAIETSTRLSRWTTMAIGTVVALVVGILIEIAQRFVPWRSSDLRDLEADVAGLVLALLLLGAGSAWSRRRGSRPRLDS